MAGEQDDRERVKQMTRRAIKTSTYCIAPLMMGLAGCAPAIVHLLLTDKWLPCVPYMRIFCITYMFWPIHSANLNAIKASIVGQIINTWPNRKLLKYGYFEQLKDIFPGITLAAVMGILVSLLNYLPYVVWIKLIIQIFTGIIIYIIGSLLFKLESYRYLKNSIKEKLASRKDERNN